MDLRHDQVLVVPRIDQAGAPIRIAQQVVQCRRNQPTVLQHTFPSLGQSEATVVFVKTREVFPAPPEKVVEIEARRSVVDYLLHFPVCFAKPALVADQVVGDKLPEIEVA
ncbi:MAG: hypothetical protein H0W66_11885 [Chthoniobacterales bacterium]|nr:hypothetical protein [Chthoniobacterales bacterium]